MTQPGAGSGSGRAAGGDSDCSGSGGAQSAGLLREVWRTGVWRLFPLFLIYITSYAVVLPIVPTLTTDFFASRAAGYPIRCEDYQGVESPPPAACRDAHSVVVAWQTASTFLSSAVFALILSPMVGSWSDAYGRKPFLIAPIALALLPTTVLLLHIDFGVSLLFIFPAQALNGAFSASSIALAYVADLMPARHRAATFGLILASFSMGIIVGPLLGAMLTPMAAAAMCVGGLVVSLAYVALLLPESLTREACATAAARQKAAAQTGVAGRWASARILLRSSMFVKLTLVTMLTGIVFEGLQDLLIQFLQLTVQFNTQDQGRIFMMYGAAGLVVQTLLLRCLLGAFGEQRTLFIGTAASLVQEVLLAFVRTKGGAYAVVLLGTLGGVAFPAISSIKSNNVHEFEQGTVQGALAGARSLANGVGPLFFSALFAAFTRDDSPLPYFPGAPFLLGAALMLASLVVIATIEPKAGSAQQHLRLAPLEGDVEAAPLLNEAGMYTAPIAAVPPPGIGKLTGRRRSVEASVTRTLSAGARARVAGAKRAAAAVVPEKQLLLSDVSGSSPEASEAASGSTAGGGACSGSDREGEEVGSRRAVAAAAAARAAARHGGSPAPGSLSAAVRTVSRKLSGGGRPRHSSSD